jgi:HEAT repeat protein
MTPATVEERELRPIALRALANCLTGQEEGLAPSLMPLAQDADRFTKAAALLCLGRIADRRGMRAVVAAILEDDPVVVESAAVALSEGIREEDTDLVRPLLVALAKRPAPRLAVREAILIALSRIAIEEPAWRVRARHRVRRELAGGTASMRKAAIVLLERMYADDDPPPLSVIDDMLGRLDDDHPEVRVVAASFLARHLEPGLTGAAARLRAGIARKERTLSLLCLDALHRHATDVARGVIATASRDPDSAVAARAATLLATTSTVTGEWAFTPRAARPTTPPLSPPSTTPRPADPSRPSRVRPADAADDDVVEARDPTP